MRSEKTMNTNPMYHDIYYAVAVQFWSCTMRDYLDMISDYF